MQTLKLLIIILTISQNLNSQTFKTIVLDKNPKQVPEGRYWKIKKDTETKLQFSSGSFKSGTMCNALLFSNPHVATFLSYGTSPYNHDNSYMFLTDNATKIPYSNEKTFSFLIKSIVKSNFDLTKLQYSGLGSVGEPELIILPGTYVRVGECIDYFELQEYVLTTEFLNKLNKEKELQADKEKNQALKEKLDKENTKLSNLSLGKTAEGKDYELFYIQNKSNINIAFQDSFPYKLFEIIFNIEKDYKKSKRYFKDKYYSKGYIDGLCYNYQLHFDKNGELYSITTQVVKDVYPDDYELPSSDYLALKKYIKYNGQGKVIEKGTEYNVQYYENLKTNYFVQTTKTINEVSFKKNKTGEIKVLKLTKNGSTTKFNTTDDLQKFLATDDEIKKLEKGNYRFEITEEFNNYELKTELEYKKINNSYKLGTEYYISFGDIKAI